MVTREVRKRVPAELGRAIDDLARVARTLADAQELCFSLARLLDNLRAKAGFVSGEDYLLSQLQTRIAQVKSSLETLHTAPMTLEAANERVASIRELLSGPDWHVARDSIADLEGRLTEQEKQLVRYRRNLETYRAPLNDVRRELQKARRGGAVVDGEDKELLAIEDIIRQAERALQEQKYLELSELFERLPNVTTSSPTLQQAETDWSIRLRKQVRERVEEARPFARQSDLALLRSVTESTGQVRYAAALRTPSEPGTHGVSLEGFSTPLALDVKQIQEKVLRISEAIGSARRGQAAAAGRVNAPNGTVQPARGVLGAPAPTTTPTTQATSVSLAVQDLGDFMYQMLLPEHLQGYLADMECALTITANDMELPWELLSYTSRETRAPTFLCLDKPVARMPLGRAFPRRSRPAELGTMRFLLVYADPDNDLPSARAEIDAIAAGLKDTPGRSPDVVVIAGPECTLPRLNDEFRSGRYAVIHFAGHATFDATDPDKCGLLLHDRTLFTSERIRRLVEGQPLVFLNACETGAAANEHADRGLSYLQEPSQGLASAFIYGGAAACVGSRWPILDAPAAEFAMAFYRPILDGYNIGEAMRRARRKSRDDYPEQITWASFVLYGNPSFRPAEKG